MESPPDTRTDASSSSDSTTSVGGNLTASNSLSEFHSLLRRLCRHNETMTFQAFIELLQRSGVFDPQTPDETGQTALHILVQNGDPYDFNKFVDKLLSFIDEADKEAFINAKDTRGKTALFYATTNNVPWKMSKLLQLGANPLQDDPHGISILHGFLAGLHVCCQEESLDVLRTLLNRGCNPNAIDGRGRTALHILTCNGTPFDFSTFLSFLLDFIDETVRNDYINARDMNGKSALYYATHSFAPRKVLTLLNVLADPRLEDLGGSSILYRLLSRLHSLNQDDSLLAISTLLIRGCDPTVQDGNGQTGLHILVKNGFVNFDRLTNTLLFFVDETRRIAFVNAQDAVGKSALFYAVEYHSAPHRIRKLLDLLANPNLQDNERQTPLHLLTKKQSSLPSKSEIVTMLLDHGADPTIVDNRGHQPLDYLGDDRAFDASSAFIILQRMGEAGFF